MKKILNLIIGLITLGSATIQAASTFVGNGSAGFGGPIGNGSLLVSDTSAGNLSFTLTRGTTGGLNDAFVIYLDTVSGGASSTSSFTDTGIPAGTDGLRKAISGFNGTDRSLLTFATGFSADYAIALNGGFAGIWNLSTPTNFGWVGSANLQRTGGTGNNDASTYSFDLDVSLIGLTGNSGQSFNFFTTYLAESAWRSTETMGASYSGSPAAGFSAFTAAGANSYTLIPEPSSSLLMGLGLAGLAVLRRNRKNT